MHAPELRFDPVLHVVNALTEVVDRGSHVTEDNQRRWTPVIYFGGHSLHPSSLSASVWLAPYLRFGSAPPTPLQIP
jgi:hypothetical protein